MCSSQRPVWDQDDNPTVFSSQSLRHAVQGQIRAPVRKLGMDPGARECPFPTTLPCMTHPPPIFSSSLDSLWVLRLESRDFSYSVVQRAVHSGACGRAGGAWDPPHLLGPQVS